MEEFQTITTFNFAHEIIISRSIFQNEGIPFLFQKENLSSIDLFAIYYYGGIHTKVHRKDFERVQEILNNLKIVQ